MDIEVPIWIQKNRPLWATQTSTQPVHIKHTTAPAASGHWPLLWVLSEGTGVVGQSEEAAACNNQQLRVAAMVRRGGAGRGRNYKMHGIGETIIHYSLQQTIYWRMATRIRRRLLEPLKQYSTGCAEYTMSEGERGIINN